MNLLISLIAVTGIGPGIGAEPTAEAWTWQTAAAGQARVKTPRKRLAVMDIELKVDASGAAGAGGAGDVPPPSDFGSGMTEMLTTALAKTGRFVLLERKAIQDILDETRGGVFGGTGQEGEAPPLIQAQALIRGAITEYSYRTSSTGGSISILGGLSGSGSQLEAMVAIDLRIFDPTNGVILDSVRGEGKAKASARNISLDKESVKLSAEQFQSTPLGHATRQAIERAVAQIVEKLEKLVWEARVADVDEEEDGSLSAIYITAGSETGLAEGDRLEVLRPGRALKDPQSGQVIGRARDRSLGFCRIETVQEGLAIAIPEGELRCEMGDVVRIAAAR